MSTDVAEIQAKIRSLTLEDKTERICALIAELDGSADPDVERAWLEEALSANMNETVTRE